MSELVVGSLSGLAANSYVIDVASGSSLDVTNATGTLPAAQLPTGSVLQVVSATYGTITTTSSSTFVNTNLSLSITPSSATSKVLILANVPARGERPSAQNSGGMVHAIARGGSRIVESGFALYTETTTQNRDIIMPVSMIVLDSPNTTSSVTYTHQHRMNDGSPAVTTSFLGSVTGHLIALEIAG